MEDYQATLDNYKLQLGQVNAALSADAQNAELLKLKEDLTEVIQLTEEMAGINDSKAAAEEEISAPSAKKRKTDTQSNIKWNVGDKCMAYNSTSKRHEEALVHDLLPEGETVVVKFDKSSETDICQLSSLKPTLANNLPGLDGKVQYKGKLMSKKEKMIQEREYKKKRNLKKKMKLKEKEAQSEISKNNWQNFHKKVKSKSSKGVIKKSIFASPAGLQGKVGVGTCGVGDKPMTKTASGAKYNARHMVPR